MKKPDVSIVVPVYNAAKYLNRCLDSIMGQSYGNWECVLVDDGSVDDSGRICDEYVEKDKRFRVVHKENGGVSSARNVGIDRSEGEWLYFCDADDELLSDGLETLIRAAVGSASDVVFGGYVECSEDGGVIASPRCEIRRNLSVKETVWQLYRASYSSYEGYLWCKLFKADLVKECHLAFAEDVFFNEDRLFIIQCLRHVTHDVVYTSDVVYRYYHHPQSAYWSLQRRWNPRYITDLKAYVRMYEEVCGITTDKRIRLMAQEGIRSSVKTIRRMLKKNCAKDSLAENELARVEKLYLTAKDRIRLYCMRKCGFTIY
jgi:glycosyltransferase involved in cell wall biosynthesis